VLSETTTSVQRGHVSGWKSEVNMAGDMDLIIHGCQGVRVMELTIMAVIASKLAILLRL